MAQEGFVSGNVNDAKAKTATQSTEASKVDSGVSVQYRSPP